MLQPRGELDLAPEPVDADAGGQLGREHLDHDLAAERGLAAPRRRATCRRRRARARGCTVVPTADWSCVRRSVVGAAARVGVLQSTSRWGWPGERIEGSGPSASSDEPRRAPAGSTGPSAPPTAASRRIAGRRERGIRAPVEVGEAGRRERPGWVEARRGARVTTGGIELRAGREEDLVARAAPDGTSPSSEPDTRKTSPVEGRGSTNTPPPVAPR